MKGVYLYFFLVIYLCYEAPCRAEKYKYEFEVTVVDSIGSTNQEIENFKQHFLVKLSEEEQIKLCMDAKKHAALDGPQPDANGKILAVGGFTIIDTDKKSSVDVAIRCETIPRSHLILVNQRSFPELDKNCSASAGVDSSESDYNSEDLVLRSVNEMITGSSAGAYNTKEILENSVKWITILLSKNRFTKDLYTFSVDKITSVPELAGSVAKDFEKTPEGDLYRMYDHDRLYACVAAKKHIKEVVPELTELRLGGPQIFHFRYGPDDVRTLTAIKCLSTPPMFLHFKERYRQNRPILVIWVDTKGKTTVQEDENTSKMELAIEKTEPETRTKEKKVYLDENGMGGTEPPESVSESSQVNQTTEPAPETKEKTPSASPKKAGEAEFLEK